MKELNKEENRLLEEIRRYRELEMAAPSSVYDQ